MKKQWQGKSRGGALGNWFFIVTLKYLGVNAAYILLAFVAPYFVFFAPKARRAIWFFYRQILKYGRWESFRLLFLHFYRFGQAIVDRMAIKHNITKPYHFEYHNFEEFLRVLDSNQGAIIIGAHVGAWEVGAPFFMHYGKKMNIVMLDAEYENIKRVIEKDATERDFKVIPLTDDGLEAVLKIKNALDNKEFVCVQGDRFMNEKNTIAVDFLGQKALFPTGIFSLATKFKVPVVFYFAIRDKHKTYHFHFEINENFSSKDDIFQKYIVTLENIVRENPQQWFNFYQFWST